MYVHTYPSIYTRMPGRLQVCALVQGLFAPQITPRLLPAVDNRVTVLLGGGAGAGAGGRCVGRVLFGTEEDGDDDRPIFPRYVPPAFHRHPLPIG